MVASGIREGTRSSLRIPSAVLAHRFYFRFSDGPVRIVRGHRIEAFFGEDPRLSVASSGRRSRTSPTLEIQQSPRLRRDTPGVYRRESFLVFFLLAFSGVFYFWGGRHYFSRTRTRVCFFLITSGNLHARRRV